MDIETKDIIDDAIKSYASWLHAIYERDESTMALCLAHMVSCEEKVAKLNVSNLSAESNGSAAQLTMTQIKVPPSLYRCATKLQQRSQHILLTMPSYPVFDSLRERVNRILEMANKVVAVATGAE